MAQHSAVLIASLALLVCVVQGAVLSKRDGPCACSHEFAPVCADADGRRLTLSNSCHATCRDATVLHTGACVLSECRCPRSYEPVCGEDGVVYNNECITDCLGVAVQWEGPCVYVEHHHNSDKKQLAKKSHEACICTLEWNPVCGADGVTYGNACSARCNGVAVTSSGGCPDLVAEQLPVIPYDSDDSAEHLYPFHPIVIPGSVDEDEDGVAKKQVKKTSEPCICTADYSPVCGSNGVTYANACAARCSGVSVTSSGPCEPPRPAQLPVFPDKIWRRNQGRV